MSQPNTAPAPSLFVSERFVDQASELGFDHVQINPADIAKVVHLGRHNAIEDLGGIMLHGDGERKGNHATRYHAVYPTVPVFPQLDGDILTQREIVEAGRDFRTPTLALLGVQPSEPAVSLELYRAASKWQDPTSQMGGGPDTWFGIGGGGALGLAGCVIANGMEMTASDLVEYAYSVGIGAAIGGLFLKPALRRLRLHFDTPAVQALRPIMLSAKPA